MKKIALAFLCLIMCCGVLVACGDDEEKKPEELKIGDYIEQAVWWNTYQIDETNINGYSVSQLNSEENSLELPVLIAQSNISLGTIESRQYNYFAFRTKKAAKDIRLISFEFEFVPDTEISNGDYGILFDLNIKNSENLKFTAINAGNAVVVKWDNLNTVWSSSEAGGTAYQNGLISLNVKNHLEIGDLSYKIQNLKIKIEKSE